MQSLAGSQADLGEWQLAGQADSLLDQEFLLVVVEHQLLDGLLGGLLGLEEEQ